MFSAGLTKIACTFDMDIKYQHRWRLSWTVPARSNENKKQKSDGEGKRIQHAAWVEKVRIPGEKGQGHQNHFPKLVSAETKKHPDYHRVHHQFRCLEHLSMEFQTRLLESSSPCDQAIHGWRPCFCSFRSSNHRSKLTVPKWGRTADAGVLIRTPVASLMKPLLWIGSVQSANSCDMVGVYVCVSVME